jgi:hypothetical protein
MKVLEIKPSSNGLKKAKQKRNEVIIEKEKRNKLFNFLNVLKK